MSSKGSSSRAKSWNAFEGDFLSSSTLVGRETSDFSWSDSSQQESASHQDNAAKGSSRLAGGQEEAEPTSSGNVEWSYSHYTLTLTIWDSCRLVKRYGLEVDIPTEVRKAHKPPRGYVTVSKSFLKFGVRFPLNQFFRDVLRFYRLTVF